MATFQLIRNATIKLKFGGKTFLIDPMLGPKGSFESYGEIAKNPIIDLPSTPEEILKDVDVVLISHLHKDHFDEAARELIPKDMPIFCQPGDRIRITASGFTTISEIPFSEEINRIKITRTGGKHGRGEIEKHMGNVSGFIFQHPDEPTLYVVGDSIFNEEVKAAIDRNKPQYIVTNSGGAFIPGFEKDLILMDEKETLELARYASEAKIIAVHLEALDHCTVNRASLKRSILSSNLKADQFEIVMDGQSLALN